MAKFCGEVGFIEDVENPPGSGIWKHEVSEVRYKGDIQRNTKRNETGTGANDNITINNQISILSDPYGLNHFFAIRYVRWMNAVWNVTSVEVAYPRLILTLGGLYNGETARTSSRT